MFKAKTLKTTVISLMIFLGILVPVSPVMFVPGFAQTGDSSDSIQRVQDPAERCQGNAANCGEVKDLYTNFINPAINLLSVVVGLVVVAMIIVGGIQFSASGGNPQKAKDANKKITNALIALVAYLFLFAFLQWIVPGGIF